MPPKKEKGKDAAPAMTPKEKKIWAKFGPIKAEGPDGKEVSIASFRRDELEWAVERLREQAQLQRSERIRYQLERDFLYEMQETYRKKLECLLLEQETLLAQHNRAAQDAEDNKVIKGMEGKHFRAETQIKATQQAVRDEVRKKKLQDLLDKTWATINFEMDEQDAIMARNQEIYKKKISDTQKKLQDLHKYMDDHEKQLDEFITNLEKEKKNSLELFFVLRRMENQLSEERWDEFIWKLSSNFEQSLKEMKNFYNDASFSNFTMMYTLQDMITSSVNRMEHYSLKIKELQHMMQEAHLAMPQLRVTFVKARVRHDRIVRTKQGIKTVNKELQLTQAKFNALRVDYRQNFHRLENINAERESFRSSGTGMVEGVLTSYKNRYHIDEEESKLAHACETKLRLKELLQGHFKDPERFESVVGKFVHRANEKEEMVQKYHLRAIQVRKQTQNLKNSLQARLKKVGLTKKHATILPTLPPVDGRQNWGPANLVAGKSYPVRPTGFKPCRDMKLGGCRNGEEIQTAVPVCMTNSIRDFMRLKQQRLQENFYFKNILRPQ